MNLMIVGVLGDLDVDVEVWQTPTSVTYEIIKADDPLDAYFEWVRKIGGECAGEHIQRVKDRVLQLKKAGFTIEYHVI